MRAEGVHGVRPKVIEGVREAELTFASALLGIPVTRDEATVVDVGGGSTEMVRTRSGELAPVGIDIGAVRIAERFALTAPTSSAACAEVLAHATDAPRSRRPAATPHSVAVAGAATTLATIAGKVGPFDPPRIHGAQLSI